MNEQANGREDVEAEWHEFRPRPGYERFVLHHPVDQCDDRCVRVHVFTDAELAAHVEAVRVSERVRLAGEVEALRSALDRTEHNFCLAVQGKPVRDMAENLGENKAARVLTAGVRLTEEE